jgi:1,4-alpha-glucan branching enzyme
MPFLNDQQISAILRSDLRDPFELLGLHREHDGVSIRVFHPTAAAVAVHERGAATAIGQMERVHQDGVFVIHLPDRQFFAYDLAITRQDGIVIRVIDPYCFLPVMSEESRYLFNQGNHQRIYDDLGSHPRAIDGAAGVVFAVWAPNAKRVSVVGDFNGWDGRCHPMRLLGSSGVWELFVPGLGAGTVYKYEIKKSHNDHLALKTDPLGYYQEPFPYHGSRVVDLDEFAWEDGEWIEQRSRRNKLNQPMSIYEVHLGSWKKKSASEEDRDYLNYQELAAQLSAYVLEMGYTHVELMPVQEHPFVPSWGYQVTGFFAANQRFGPPAGLQYLVNYLHKQGIGVILDWVPGHFPKDAFGLAHFDGTHLYEYADPREGEHKDWGTLIFNFGRHEVRNFLCANALFWVEKFHVDGLRVDAVASMLYRNYSRKQGEWIPNKHGGVENLEAIEFIQSFNYLVHTKFPGVVTIAEESTAWPMVSRPTYVGGLGFTYKWNMGWMHDILLYFSKEPIYRKHHHDQLTFGLWYAYSENFVLVLSHDEVVHGKRSILEKMPGDGWQKFANVRALYGFMYGHPGKKLLFMGGEFGMHNEWFEKRGIDWYVLEQEQDHALHCGLKKLVVDLNRLYREEPALWEIDFENTGFSWIDTGDRDRSIVAFFRTGSDPNTALVFVCNFTPVVRTEYRVGVPFGGFFKEMLNSDSEFYGGSGVGNSGGVQAQDFAWNGRKQSLNLTLPPLAVLVFKGVNPRPREVINLLPLQAGKNS